MFAKFNLKLGKDDLKFNEDFYNIGLGMYVTQKRTVHSNLDKYLAPDGSLDAASIEADWFPTVNAHVFLSHSHHDEAAVLRLAGFLSKNYGITSFIDSTVWGYANDLLKQIDDKYCVQSTKPGGGHTYDYDRRNYSTAHVHMMLQGALAKMINRCEALIFINTPNSLNMKDIGKESTTSSPWIYSELLIANTFPARSPQFYEILKAERTDSFEHFSLDVKYKVGLQSFVGITLNDIQNSANKVGRKIARKVLDQIYLDKGLMKVDVLKG